MAKSIVSIKMFDLNIMLVTTNKFISIANLFKSYINPINLILSVISTYLIKVISKNSNLITDLQTTMWQ